MGFDGFGPCTEAFGTCDKDICASGMGFVGFGP